MHKDLSTRHDWPVKKAIVNLSIRLMGNFKRTSGNSFCPFGAQNRNIGDASQTSQTGVTLRLRHRLTQHQCSGGSRAPLIFRGRKYFSVTAPPPPFKVLDDPPPPPYLKVWIQHCSEQRFQFFKCRSTNTVYHLVFLRLTCRGRAIPSKGVGECVADHQFL